MKNTDYNQKKQDTKNNKQDTKQKKQPSNRDYYNREGYADPTAYEAIRNASRKGY